MGNSVAARFVAFLNKLSVLIFIAAVILIIYFFARYIKFSNRRRSTAFHRALRNHLAQENPSIVDMPVGLAREVIEALPAFVYEPQHMKMVLDCAVCLCAFQENEKGRMLPNCNHSFHIDCIDMWLSSHSTCPICREKVDASSPGQQPESGVRENLGAVSSCGHGSKGQSSSSSVDMDEAKPLPETAIDISDRF